MTTKPMPAMTPMPLEPTQPITAKWNKEDPIRLRLARAQEDVRALTQDAVIETKTRKYRGVSAAQIVTIAKSALLSNGIIFIPHPDPDRVRVDGQMVAVWVTGEFSCLDNPAGGSVESGAWGAGMDNGDKAYAKAYTNAQKLILTKALGMSTLEEEEGTPAAAQSDKAAGKQKLVLSEDGSKLQADDIIAALNKLSKPLSAEDKEDFIESHGAAIDTLLQADADRVRAAYKARAQR